MFLNCMFERIAKFLSVPVDNPDLLAAQHTALSGQVPMAYLVMVANAWMLSATFLDKAPLLLTLFPALLLTAVSAFRLVKWWRVRRTAGSAGETAAELRRAVRFAIANSVIALGWVLLLYPYGDTAARVHLANVLSTTAIGIMLCMTQLRTAALAVSVIVGGGSVAIYAMIGTPTSSVMAANVAIVVVAVVIIILIQNRDFIRMVSAQIEARHKDQAQTRLLHMIDDMPVAVMTVEPKTLNINYVNDTSKQLIRRIEHLLPLSADDLLGTSIDVFHRHPEHQRAILADPANLPYNARIQLGPEVLDLKISAVNDDKGSYIGPMLTWALVTKEIEAESRIRQLAHYDMLTSLPNRNSFHEQLEAAFASPGNHAGLLFIDLDGFKIINDSKGHRIGDALLQQVAERLRAACDGLRTTIGRIGGDEFAILLPCDDADEAITLAGNLIETLGAPYELDHDRELQISASIGLAFAPHDAGDGETLLARADMALYAAKNAGKRTFRVFSSDMEARIQERVRLEAKLRTALETQDGLFVFYQPIVDIETGKVTSREALVRWHHPLRGWVSPAEFVPVAEQSGLIDRLGLFVLNRACHDAAGWDDGARVAVNVSANQLGKGRLAPAVLAALVDSGLSPDRLEIEVTETALLTDEAETIVDLRRLRDMGVRVALDDFGTGFSSLSHLRVFPFDKIKIDGSFVRDAVKRPDCAAVVKAVADLGKRLGVTTVAEGVETQAHLDRVREEGCREVQGYFYGRPVPRDRDVALVEELNRAARPAAAKRGLVAIGIR